MTLIKKKFYVYILCHLRIQMDDIKKYIVWYEKTTAREIWCQINLMSDLVVSVEFKTYKCRFWSCQHIYNFLDICTANINLLTEKYLYYSIA